MKPLDLGILMLKKPIGLGTKEFSFLVVFAWHNQLKVYWLFCTHVDDFLFGGTGLFVSKIINPNKLASSIGSEQCDAFKYLGRNISQYNLDTIMDQVN